jgi:toxin YoeB
MKIIFMSTSWEDYLYWQKTEKNILRKINSLIREIERTPFEGTGKPEPLNYNLAGWWSRRLNLEHRLIYRIENDSIIILQCRYYY